MPRALLSVTDKSGLTELAQALVAHGYTLLSTGGTARTLREAGLAVTDVSEVTGFPEIMDGRVKTLHPNIHGGLLADRSNPAHHAALAEHGIENIEILGVNLYEFEKTVQGGADLPTVIENIDIGGPAMLRAAAKNHGSVLVVTNPAQYADVVRAVAEGTEADLRAPYAALAFAHTAAYDALISRYLRQATGQEELGETLTVTGRRQLALRYGENPHQAAALYADPLGAPGIAQAVQHSGKELSYNNILDADAAWGLVMDLPAGSMAIIKHGNPCGAATGATGAEAYDRARASDPISAFGGIAAYHGHLDVATAKAMTAKGNFLEVILALGYEDEALDLIANRSGWGADVRVLAVPAPSANGGLSLRTVSGGFLAQSTDTKGEEADWRVATDRQPTEAEWEALRMAWRIVPHVKSNGIVIAGPEGLRGVGAGQMNRVQSVRLSIEQAGEGTHGAALASDAFFPFPDSIETAHAAGVTAVIQPGGSKKDGDVIAKANELGIAMILTGRRHFRH